MITVVSAVLKMAGISRKFHRPKPPPENVRWLTQEEAGRLIEACSPHLRPLVIFMLYTGARAGEALWLDWRNVDLSRAHVSFPKTKNGTARGVPLHPNLIAALASLKHRDGEVFRRPDGEPYERPQGDDDRSAGSRRLARHSAGLLSGQGSRILECMTAAIHGPAGITRSTGI